jgi:hypothetical protein
VDDMNTIQAYCFRCEKTVSAHFLLSAIDLSQVLRIDEDIEVMHSAEDGDHRWKLTYEEKQKLREARKT